MWIDDDGVFHTVALPDPTELMNSTFRESLDSVVSANRPGVSDLLAAEQILVYESAPQLVTDRDVEAEYEGATPPIGLLSRTVATLEDLREVIAATPARWRLDAIVALDDYVG